ncbi:MAG TPA: hypothetical protein VFC87_02425, partial [Perlabentimonas sp.]|nr:hypothetical protein [Perlabentimonas sp.]
SAKSFMKTIKSLTREFRQINESFNSAGVLTNTKSDDDIYILLKGKYKDNLDVDMLATAFNMDKLEIKHKVIVLPDNLEFDEDDEIIGFIIDGGFFRIWPTLFEDSLQANAAGLFTNNFLTTVWIFSYATFFNAVVLKKK